MPQSRRRPITTPEHLELRVLPTVIVNFNPDSGLLKITGDNAPNRIDLDGLGNFGQFELFIDNTLFDDYSGVESVKVNLKGGDDQLYINAVRLIDKLTVNMGSGADELDMDNSINLGTGPDGTTYVESTVKINMGGDQGDLVDFDDNVGFNGDVTIKGAADVDFDGDGLLPDNELVDVFFNRKLTIDLSSFGDVNGDNLTLDFDNVYALDCTINGSNAADIMQITLSSFFLELNLNLSGGDDVVDIDNGAAAQNKFISGIKANGGSGNDTFQKGLDNIFLAPDILVGFETVV